MSVLLWLGPVLHPVLAAVLLAPGIVLAVEAAERAVREEDGSGAARARDRRFLAEMGPVTEDAHLRPRPAIAPK